MVQAIEQTGKWLLTQSHHGTLIVATTYLYTYLWNKEQKCIAFHLKEWRYLLAKAD